MSADLNWMIVRNNHAFLMKRRNIKKPFSSEPGNLKNVNSLHSNGFVNKKVINVEPFDGKGGGVVLSFKKSKHLRMPAKNVVKSTIKSGPRRALVKLRNFVKFNNYRKDLTMAVLRRASAIHRSQKALPFKSKRRIRKIGKIGKVGKAGKGSKKAE